MKLIRYFFLPVLLACITQPVRAQSPANWQELKTVEDVCRSYPQRMDTLLQSLDLDRAGLGQVKKAYTSGDIVAACRHLLDYYQEGKSAAFLRRELPVASSRRSAEADLILGHTYTFYTQTDQVPTRPDGHQDWDWQGPAKDIEWAWGLNRHGYLNTLLVGYFETGNKIYAQTLDHHLKDWVTASLPYPRKKSSTSMWRGLEVALRIKHWANTFYGLIGSDAFSPATRLLMLSSLPEHAHYLRSFHAQGNWLTMEMSGLAMIAAAWPEFEQSAAWLDYCRTAMTESLQEQVYPDGVQTELTSHYHYVALINFDQFLQTCKEANVELPDIFPEYIERMWNYLAYAIRPDGTNPLNNDSDLGNYQERIIQAAERFNRPDWLYIASNGKKGTAPEKTSLLFPYAGQALLRSGWDEQAHWSFFDVGPWGSGHQHNDKLHLSVSAFGRDLLVDGGRFAYRGDVARQFRPYALGTESHNTLLIDGKGQSAGPKETENPLGDGHFSHSEQMDYAWNEVDHFQDLEGRAVHSRAVAYVRGQFWVVVDRVQTDRSRRIEALWHWHPDCRVVMEPNGVIASNNEQGNLQVMAADGRNWAMKLVRGQETPEPQGWYSREYNKYEPNTAAIYSTEIDGDAYFVWLLYPSEKALVKVKTRILSREENGIGLRVKSKAGKWELFVPFSDSAAARLK